MTEPEINRLVSLIIERWKDLGIGGVFMTLEGDAPHVWVFSTPTTGWDSIPTNGHWASLDSENCRMWLTQSLMMGKASWYQTYLREKVD